MSLRPMPIPPVPTDTARVARAAFPKGNYMKLRERIGTIIDDEDFVTLFAKDGAPGLPPWRLALVTILQFHENLSDRQAAEAVRARIDWKYVLSLELTDEGFDFSVLSEFRTRLMKGGAAELLLYMQQIILHHFCYGPLFYASPYFPSFSLAQGEKRCKVNRRMY